MPVLHEPLSPPLPTDAPNLGYVLGDIICPDCYSTLLREILSQSWLGGKRRLSPRDG